VLVDDSGSGITAAEIARHQSVQVEAVGVEQRRQGGEAGAGGSLIARVVRFLGEGSGAENHDAEWKAAVRIGPQNLECQGPGRAEQAPARTKRQRRHRHRKQQRGVRRPRSEQPVATAGDDQ